MAQSASWERAGAADGLGPVVTEGDRPGVLVGESLPYWLQTSLPTVQTVGQRQQTLLKETRLPPKPPPWAWREWEEQQQRQEQAAPNPQKDSQFDELD